MDKEAGCKTWNFKPVPVPSTRKVQSETPAVGLTAPRLMHPSAQHGLSLCRTDHVKAPVMAFHTIGISALLKLPYRRVAECIRAECHH